MPTDQFCVDDFKECLNSRVGVAASLATHLIHQTDWKKHYATAKLELDKNSPDPMIVLLQLASLELVL